MIEYKSAFSRPRFGCKVQTSCSPDAVCGLYPFLHGQPTDKFFLIVWWTICTINWCGFLAREPSEIIHSPVNGFVPPFFSQAVLNAGKFSHQLSHIKHLIVKIFPPMPPAPFPILHKWPAGLDSVFFSLQFIIYLFHSLIRAERSGLVKRARWSTSCVLMFGATYSLSLTLLSSSDVLCSSLKHPLHLRISIRVMVRLLCVIRLQKNINNNNKNNSSLWSAE